MNRPPLPFSRSYWVEPGLFMAGYNPGPRRDKPSSEHKLTRLFECGIRTIVNLMEEGETYSPHPFNRQYKVEPYEETAHRIARAMGLEVTVTRFGMEDAEVPDPARMIEVLDFIDSEIKRESPVYLHCQGGIGRTGMVVGCWLIRHNVVKPSRVLHHIHLLREGVDDGYGHPRMSPETREQERFVASWLRGR